jgi:glycosyltransferase involved in cell wall biosynthesis
MRPGKSAAVGAIRVKLLGVLIHHGYSPEARVFANLLRHMDGRYQASVIYNCWPDHPQGVDAFEEHARVHVARIDTGWRPNDDGRRSAPARALSVLQFYARLPRLIRIARQVAPDVVYSCQQTWDCLAGMYIARDLNRPQVLHLHCKIAVTDARNRYQRQAIERLRMCDHVVAVSEFVRRCAVDAGTQPSRVTTILSGMEMPSPPTPGTREAVRRELGVPSDAPVVAIVGRLVPTKGQHDTIAAFARIAGRERTAHLVIVGEGTLRPSLEAEAAQSGFGDRIHFTGRRTDVPQLLAAADVFVHPSRQEGFGLAVLEASAAGLPVVAYADGGILELVANGETGILVPVGDIAALASALDHMISDPDAARRLGRAGRDRVATVFRPERPAHEFATLLRCLAG